eukprot:TRINITY_DN58170_c0_g1_i2.p1 TRINITY_DN58170_c0_g1~~TRINITY_DN58170_c0_g1_i2.p1  ORF type:complete len:720 (-),score=31.56 TRINITY_DN58170_c0_g1_i2:73-1965(-)
MTSHSDHPCCSYSTNPLELWISLYEKAFLKVHNGSYEFPGSNSGADLYSLCGWIPEILALDKITTPEMKKEKWDQLYKAHEAGEMLLTTCTSDELDPSWEEKLGLVPGHAYAILEMKQIPSKHSPEPYRLVLVKNPWTHQRWLGRFSHQDKKNWTPELVKALKWDEMRQYGTDNGIFWIDWNDLVKFFHRCHLSWNPYKFSYRFAVHGSWGKSFDEHKHYARNPQYHLTFKLDKPTEIWILLCMHVHNSNTTEWPFITLRIVDNKKTTGVNTDKLCCGPQGCTAKRLYVANGDHHTYTGVYRNTPQHLVRLQCEAGVHDYIVVVSLCEKMLFDYSVTTYSPTKDVCFHVMPSTRYTERAAFVEMCNIPAEPQAHDNLNFLHASQYRLIVKQPMHFLVRAEIADHLIDIILVQWGEQATKQHQNWKGRIGLLNEGTVMAKFMGKGFCYLDTFEILHGKALPPANYTLIVKTPDKSKCIVRLESSSPDAVQWKDFQKVCKIAPEGYRLNHETVKGLFGVGHKGNKDIHSNPTFKIYTNQSTSLTLRLRHTAVAKNGGLGSLNVFILDSTKVNTLESLPQYTPYAVGACINGFQLQSRQEIYVVCCTFDGNYQGPFQLDVYSEVPVTVSTAVR